MVDVVSIYAILVYILQAECYVVGLANVSHWLSCWRKTDFDYPG